MNNINEKCNTIPTDVCATTECCVLFGGEKCVEGDENGPKSKMVYSDTSIKNRDVYYYQGDCYGNCQKGPRYVPPKQPENKKISPAPAPAMISPAPSSAVLNPTPSSEDIQPVPTQNAQDLPNKLAPTPPTPPQTQQLPEIPTQTMSIPGQNPQILPNAKSITNTANKHLNRMF